MEVFQQNTMLAWFSGMLVCARVSMHMFVCSAARQKHRLWWISDAGWRHTKYQNSIYRLLHILHSAAKSSALITHEWSQHTLTEQTQAFKTVQYALRCSVHGAAMLLHDFVILQVIMITILFPATNAEWCGLYFCVTFLLVRYTAVAFS